MVYDMGIKILVFGVLRSTSKADLNKFKKTLLKESQWDIITEPTQFWTYLTPLGPATTTAMSWPVDI